MSGAPRCSWPSCSHKTWNPDGMCYEHTGRVYGQDVSSRDANPVPPSSHPGTPNSDPHQVFAQTAAVFPDINHSIDPQSVREQVVHNLQAAVSIEVYRRFPSTDVSNAEQRAAMLQQHHREMVELGTLTPQDVPDELAVSLSSASDDVYGRGYEDSVGLSSYGLRKEWELARSMNIEHDESGTPYGNSFSEYCSTTEDRMRQVVSDEYMRQMVRYPHIITHVTGAAPKNQAPLFPNQDMSPNMRRAPLPTPVVRSRAQERSSTQYRSPDEDSSVTTLIREGASALAQYAQESRKRSEANEAQANQRVMTKMEEQDRKKELRHQKQAAHEEDKLRRLQIRVAKKTLRRR